MRPSVVSRSISALSHRLLILKTGLKMMWASVFLTVTGRTGAGKVEGDGCF